MKTASLVFGVDGFLNNASGVRSINQAMALGFADELSKIAGAMGQVYRKGVRAVEKGWEASGGWRAGKGRVTRYLPGGKALAVGMTATQLPNAVRKTDTSGQGKSRSERMGSLIGGTIGGLAGGAAPGMRGMVGGVAGGMAGDAIGARLGRMMPGGARRPPPMSHPQVQQAAPQAPQQAPVPSAGQV